MVSLPGAAFVASGLASCAAAFEPKLIILDEPSNGLDPQGMREIKELIVQLSSEKDIAFFISSHLIHDIEQICNRVAMIDKGKLLVEKSVKTLIDDSGGKSLEELYFEITGTGAYL